jgi:hypothetical protein
MIPQTQNTFVEDDFLAFANEEIDIGIVPHVLTFHQEYFLVTDYVTLTPNTSRYEIPTRAIGGKLRDVSYQDTGGNIFEMSRIKVDDVPSYQNNVIQNCYTLFYIEGNDLVLIPVTNANPIGFLRFSYYLRPNEMVDESRVAIVTGIDYTTGIISVDGVPTNLLPTLAPFNPLELDIIQTQPPFKSLRRDVIATDINTTANTITFNIPDIPLNLSIGDQIALAQETIVPQIPSELHSVLAQRVTARCLEALGDATGLSAANAKITEMEAKTGALLQDRVEGAPLKIVNVHSTLKRKKLYWRM